MCLTIGFNRVIVRVLTLTPAAGIFAACRILTLPTGNGTRGIFAGLVMESLMVWRGGNAAPCVAVTPENDAVRTWMQGS